MSSSGIMLLDLALIVIVELEIALLLTVFVVVIDDVNSTFLPTNRSEVACRAAYSDIVVLLLRSNARTRTELLTVVVVE